MNPQMNPQLKALLEGFVKSQQEQFDKDWKNAEQAIDKILHNWKTEKFTPRQMVEAVYCSMHTIENGDAMTAFAAAVLASRAINDSEETTTAE